MKENRRKTFFALIAITRQQRCSSAKTESLSSYTAGRATTAECALGGNSRSHWPLKKDWMGQSHYDRACWVQPHKG